MDIDLIRYSLDFIHIRFAEQSEPQPVHIILRDENNPAIGRSTGEYRDEYQMSNYGIATNLNLFDKLAIDEIPKMLIEAKNPLEAKNILNGLLNTANQNIWKFKIQIIQVGH